MKLKQNIKEKCLDFQDSRPLIKAVFVDPIKFLKNNNMQIIFHVSVQNSSEYETERAALVYYIIQKKVENAIELAINSWPGALITAIGKGQFLVSIDKENILTHKSTIESVKTSQHDQNIDYIEKAVNFMEEYYYWDLTLKDVARQVYLSPCYFSRLFNQLMGCSVLKFLTQVRMEQACKLLINTDFQISDIAGRVGYDAHHFSQVFKRNLGCTPTCYRRYAGKIR